MAIIARGDSGLHKPCDFSLRTVKEYKKVKRLLSREFDLHPSAVAIASNQVLPNQHGEAPAAFLLNRRLYINPTYRWLDLPEISYEVCLSDINVTHMVSRSRAIEVEYLLLRGSSLLPKKQVLYGQAAVVFQHETDHLHGQPIFGKPRELYDSDLDTHLRSQGL